MNSFKTPKGTVLPLLNLKGKDYLQVAHRLVWFREERPDWRILTDFLRVDDEATVARAQILAADGAVMATAHKREDKTHFADHMEKAEAGAIGRALAYCGFGTQFCSDELDEGKRIVDAPQAPKGADEKTFSGDLEITFGQWKGKTLNWVIETLGLPKAQDYANYLAPDELKYKKLYDSQRAYVDAVRKLSTNGARQ